MTQGHADLRDQKSVDLSSLFTEFKLHVDSKQAAHGFNKELAIVLTQNIPIEKLPYGPQFTDEKLSELEVQRLNQCIVLARGDSRMPEEIFSAGGFHPKFTNPSSPSRSDEKILDVALHRENPTGSGLVSFSSEMKIAEKFSKDEKGCIYIVKVTGPISPDVKMYGDEVEYSAPGGVDAQDIVAFRKLNDEKSSSSIFISNDFIKTYPQHVDAVISALMKNNEHCPSRKSINYKQEVLQYVQNYFSTSQLALNEAKKTLSEEQFETYLEFEKQYNEPFLQLENESKKKAPDMSLIQKILPAMKEALSIFHDEIINLDRVHMNRLDITFDRLQSMMDGMDFSAPAEAKVGSTQSIAQLMKVSAAQFASAVEVNEKSISSTPSAAPVHHAVEHQVEMRSPKPKF